MTVFLINNFGGGFADHIEIEPETSIAQLFEDRLPDCKASDYLIRVNRQPVPSAQTLQEGDRISITPIKIEGA